MNKFAIISNAVPEICEKFINLGYKPVYTQSVDGFISYEQKHADMQCITIKDKLFVLSECKNLGENLNNYGFKISYTKNSFTGEYPNNILLNAKAVGKYIIGKTDYLDKSLLDYCESNGYILTNVNQGYAACSILKVNDNAIITADNSIYKALQKTNIDILKINDNYIKLNGAGENTVGFIGGASANLDNNTVLFFGDITKHPDYCKIKDFCNTHNVDIDYIQNIELTDIGSAVLLNF